MGINRTTKKGYITLEAAIFLPVFIIAVLTLGYFIKVIGIQENVTYSAMDEANRLASQAYLIRAAPGFPNDLESRLQQENRAAEDVQVSGFHYLYSDLENDGLISFSVSGKVRLNLPFDLKNGFGMENHFKCRGFIGKSNRGTVMSFDDMEKEGDSQMVWIFPMSGTRYHSKSCSYVTAYATQVVLNSAIRSRYEPCRLCKPQDLPDGSFVYCFLNAGGAYHRADCKTIDRYTIEIEKEEALKKGYLPCSKCQGE